MRESVVKKKTSVLKNEEPHQITLSRAVGGEHRADIKYSLSTYSTRPENIQHASLENGHRSSCVVHF